MLNSKLYLAQISLNNHDKGRWNWQFKTYTMTKCYINCKYINSQHRLTIKFIDIFTAKLWFYNYLERNNEMKNPPHKSKVKQKQT